MAELATERSWSKPLRTLRAPWALPRGVCSPRTGPAGCAWFCCSFRRRRGNSEPPASVRPGRRAEVLVRLPSRGVPVE